jgi:hypothetical protein
MPELADLPFDDRIFLILAFSIVGLLGIAVLFTFLTLFLRRKNTREARRWARLEAKWDPVILEVLAGSEGPRSLLDLVLPTERLQFLDYLFLYARRIRGEEMEMLKTLARPFLPALAERRRGRWPERRARRIRTLGVLGMPEYAGFLEKALDDPSPLVVMIAAESLVGPGNPGFVEQVLAHLHRFAGWHPVVLARLLADVGPEATPALRPALAETHRPGWVRIVVAQALRTIRDLESADVAAEVLGRETNPDLLVECLRLLAEVGESRHRKSLLPLLRSPEFPVRAQALRALREVGGPEDLPFFREALEDDSPWVALEAARGLEGLGGIEELKALAVSDDPRSTLARQVLAK